MNTMQRYLGVVGSASFANGVQVVLLPWLALLSLNSSAQELGWVQASVLLPSLLLMLVGGVLADRYPSVKYLAGLYAALALAHFSLLGLLHAKNLQLPALIIYGMVIGAINAFIQPLRERLLANVSNTSVQRSVSWASFFQYSLQASGVLLAGQLDQIGIGPVLALQVLALLVAAALCLSLGEVKAKRFELAAWSYGLAYCWRNKITRNLTVLVAFNGFLHIGAFVVVLPLLVRDVYQRSADFYAWLQLSFVLGTIIATMGLIRRAEVQRPGRALYLCVFYAALIMLAISAGPLLRGLFILVFLWGLLTGVSASLGRSLMQSQAPQSLRGRLLSIYQLALFGSAPLGAIAAGYGAEHFGLQIVLQVSAGASILLFVSAYFLKSLWAVEQSTNKNPDPENSAP
ncbi:MFS transporter [Pseudoteredinibacter isoporae]|uniref:MFS family permease n=1 Tax=Pseudoteredinibacter isoporae TaxID=570281 RepID=A0A7X0JUG7_9GAMM|nr:MFS transporter [Pseudoteredinibacter isoporae]MBB6522059.1 MFS family permease [Pseudoteredinibacter isoporae]NHO87594.1 MFS transporter [Pseudoteredinibacter isoporae]NIB24075.1 MFS transporter [Pseudoteredinibacter isoporae]